MATEPLQNLTEQSARIGSWLLLVATNPKPQDYTWTRGSTAGSGRKIEVLLVSQDSTQYCLGQFTRKGKEPAATKAFNEATDRFKKGSVWRVNKISLAKKDPKYLGCSHKVVIDLNASNFQPVLQSTVTMPEQATPPEDLNTLLQCSPGQLIDVIAFATNVSERRQKQTPLGMRDLVDITIMDHSGDSNAAKSEFPA